MKSTSLWGFWWKSWQAVRNEKKPLLSLGEIIKATGFLLQGVKIVVNETREQAEWRDRGVDGCLETYIYEFPIFAIFSHSSFIFCTVEIGNLDRNQKKRLLLFWACADDRPRLIRIWFSPDSELCYFFLFLTGPAEIENTLTVLLELSRGSKQANWITLWWV